MTEVNRYRVFCTNSVAHYEYTWNTVAPTVCPSNGTPINTSLTSIVESISSNDVEVINLPETAFGELLTAEMTPIIQMYFSYNNNPQLTDTIITGIGTVTNSNSKAIVSTGASTNSSALLHTLRPTKYQAGEGLLLRFTGIFTNGVIGNDQLVGAFDIVDGIGFGFNDNNFAIFHRNNSVTTWINQTLWNKDVLDGTGTSGVNINFGLGFGNVFQISYQYLGFGAIMFYVENPSTGKFIFVHIIMYSNSTSLTNFSIPSFPMAIQTVNTTNTTEITTESGSWLAAIEGKEVISGTVKNNSWLSVNVSNGSETLIDAYNILSIFMNRTNKTVVYPTTFSFATSATDKTQLLRLRKNATFTTPEWTDIDTDVSVVQTLTSGTWNDDGDLIYLQIISGKGNPTVINIEITPISIFLLPGENLVITCEGVGGSGSNTGSIIWLEDQ